MCIPAFLYPQSRVSEEPAAMPIPDNAKGFPVVEDAYLKQARLRLLLGIMDQSLGTQQNPYRRQSTTHRFGTNDPNAQVSAQQQQPGFSEQPVQNPGSGNFGP